MSMAWVISPGQYETEGVSTVWEVKKAERKKLSTAQVVRERWDEKLERNFAPLILRYRYRLCGIVTIHAGSRIAQSINIQRLVSLFIGLVS